MVGFCFQNNALTPVALLCVPQRTLGWASSLICINSKPQKLHSLTEIPIVSVHHLR